MTGFLQMMWPKKLWSESNSKLLPTAAYIGIGNDSLDNIGISCDNIGHLHSWCFPNINNMFSGKCCTGRNTTTSLHTTEKVYQLRFLPTTGGAVSLLRFIVNLVMEQLSVLGCCIINLIFSFSSCENLVSLISHTSPLATLSRAHLSARTCFGQMLLLFYWIGTQICIQMSPWI